MRGRGEMLELTPETFAALLVLMADQAARGGGDFKIHDERCLRRSRHCDCRPVTVTLTPESAPTRRPGLSAFLRREEA